MEGRLSDVPARAHHVLLVEDNPDDAELTIRALRRGRLANEIEHARDGQEAIDMLLGDRHGRPLPDLVLLDLKLPKLPGLDVLETLRADPRTKTLPVVVLTSSNEDRDLIEGYLRGANSYVRKPVDFDEFMQAVEQLGLYWLVVNEPVPKEVAVA